MLSSYFSLKKVGILVTKRVPTHEAQAFKRVKRRVMKRQRMAEQRELKKIIYQADAQEQDEPQELHPSFDILKDDVYNNTGIYPDIFEELFVKVIIYIRIIEHVKRIG